jgi:hypothetical protein
VEGNTKGTAVWYITPNAVGDVTITVTFDDEGSMQYRDGPEGAKTATVTLHVVNAKMIFKTAGAEADSLARAEAGTFEVVDKDGNEIPGATYATWIYSGEHVTVVGSHTTRTWSGTIVDSGYARCNVTFGEITAEVRRHITAKARSGWAVTVDLDEDAHPGWGNYPGTLFAQNRDAAQHVSSIVWPRSPWTDGYTTARVSGGPNDQVWYIGEALFYINRESVINQHIKAAGQPPEPEDPPGVAWRTFNNETMGTDVDAFEAAIRAHEAYGQGTGSGHQKQLEDEESKADPQRDVLTAIEDNVKTAVSSIGLQSDTHDEIYDIDTALFQAIASPEPTGNWTGDIWIYYNDQWECVEVSP